MKNYQVDLKFQRYFSLHIFLFGDTAFFCFQQCSFEVEKTRCFGGFLCFFFISRTMLAFNPFVLYHLRCNRDCVDVERLPRMLEIGVRSSVATNLSRKHR